MSNNDTKIFEFTLLYSLPEDQPDGEDHLDALFEAGCDDAIPGIGRKGYIALEFAREADSAKAALESANQSVDAAIPGATLQEVRPDVVGATEIAALAKCSRQYVRKQLESIERSVPPVYCSSRHVLWHLSVLDQFLAEKTTLKIPHQVFEVSVVAMEANTAIQKSFYAVHKGSEDTEEYVELQA